MKDKVFYTKHTLNCKGKIISLETPLVMGILNITPDSFYAGGRVENRSSLLDRAEKMLLDGASILDIGGYSSRPGAEHISEEEEIARVLPAIESVKEHFPGAVISVDTFRAAVAERAVLAGASIVNDISGGDLDEDMFETVAKLQVPYIAMHMKGTPQTMVSLSKYDNIIREMLAAFQSKIFRLKNLGVKDIILDPGFGFAKTREQSLYILKNLHTFKTLNAPVLAGLSRKSMIFKTLNITPEEALNGTTVLNTIAILNGASILRVHDVKEAVEIVKLTSELSK